MKRYFYQEDGIEKGPETLAALAGKDEKILCRAEGEEKWRMLYFARIREKEEPAPPAYIAPKPTRREIAPPILVQQEVLKEEETREKRIFEEPVVWCFIVGLVLIALAVTGPRREPTDGMFLWYGGAWILMGGIGGLLALGFKIEKMKGIVLGFLIGPIGWIVLVLIWALRGEIKKTEN